MVSAAVTCYNSTSRGHVDLLCKYIVTNKSSFEHLSEWVKLTDGKHSVVRVLVGNKCDLPGRKVSQEEGEAFADSHGLDYFETSAITGTRVSEVLLYAIA